MKKAVIMALIVVSTLMVGCNLARNKSDNLISWRMFDEPESYTYDYVFRVVDSHESLELILDLRLRSGTYSWRVIDPEGNERWNHSVTGRTRFKRTTVYHPIVGEWVLQVIADEVIGDIKLIWQSYL